jgi:hypothetical protein
MVVDGRTVRIGTRWLVLAVLLSSLTLVGWAAAPPALAAVQVADTPTAAWRVNGPSYAVKVVGGTTFVGGSFTQATAPDGTRRHRANLAAFDTRTGALLEGFRADTDGPVRALAVNTTTLWVGGSYTRINAVYRSRLAAVDSTSGAVRAGFSADANSNVYGLDLRAGRLFAVGSFSTVRGVPRGRAAALDPASGTVDSRWNPDANATVLAVRADPTASRVYLAGSFSEVGTVARNGLAAVDGVTGVATTPVLRDTYRPTLALDMNESGTALFAAVGGAGNQAEAWDTGTGYRQWAQRADGDVQAVVHHAGTVYFGFHESFQGDARLRLLAADAGTGALQASFRPTFDRFWGVYALAAADGALAAAGDFTVVSGVRAQGLALFPALAQPPPPAGTSVDYLHEGSSWRYWDRGGDPGDTWRTGGFDDASWGAGRPQLGYGDGDETTVLSYGPDPANKHITTYFRASFDTGGSRPASAQISLLADDGAVVYLNGVEVVRDNMPTGVVTSSTLAATNRSGAGENALRTFSLDPARIVAGVNVVAVEVHQDYRGSSDLGLDLRLQATSATA